MKLVGMLNRRNRFWRTFEAKWKTPGDTLREYVLASSFGPFYIQEFLKCGDFKTESLWKTGIHPISNNSLKIQMLHFLVLRL